MELHYTDDRDQGGHDLCCPWSWPCTITLVLVLHYNMSPMTRGSWLTPQKRSCRDPNIISRLSETDKQCCILLVAFYLYLFFIFNGIIAQVLCIFLFWNFMYQNSIKKKKKKWKFGWFNFDFDKTESKWFSRNITYITCVLK